MKHRPAIPDAIRQQAIDWLLRLNSQHCTQADRDTFADWLSKTPIHQQAYETIEVQWNSLERLKTEALPARTEALRYRPKPKRPFWPYSAAAGLVLALGIATFSQYGWLGWPRTYSTALGGHQTVTLVDGSILELNTGTEVNIQYRYNQRAVTLVKGEAFFTVSHDSERPFSVQAGNTRIEDIGTAFDVYLKPDSVEIAVQEGLVEVQAGGKTRLTAGQQLSVTHQGQFIAGKDQDVAALTAWRTGRLVFRNRRLEDVLAELSRYHNVRIHIQKHTLADLRVSGTFHVEKLDDTLTAIATLLPVQISRVGDGDVVLQ